MVSDVIRRSQGSRDIITAMKSFWVTKTVEEFLDWSFGCDLHSPLNQTQGHLPGWSPLPLPHIGNGTQHWFRHRHLSPLTEHPAQGDFQAPRQYPSLT